MDPDARQGKKANVTWSGYKAHIVVEEQTGIIPGMGTSPANAADGSQLKPMLKEQEETHSITPQELIADKTFDWGENLEGLAGNKTIANVALSRRVNPRNEGCFNVDKFLCNPKHAKLICPAGHISTNHYK